MINVYKWFANAKMDVAYIGNLIVLLKRKDFPNSATTLPVLLTSCACLSSVMLKVF